MEERKVKKKRRREEEEEEAARELDLELAGLPEEILYLILSKLGVSAAYYARFSAVCKRWHRLVSDAWPKLLEEHPELVQYHPQLPVLVVPLPLRGASSSSCRIYNFKGDSALAQPIRFPGGFNRILGSSFGWLITADSSFDITLFNPSSQSQIRIPFMGLKPWMLPWFKNPMCYIVKAVLSKPPDDGCFDIAVMVCPMSYLSYTAVTEIVLLRVQGHEQGRAKFRFPWIRNCPSFPNDDFAMDLNSIGGQIYLLLRSGRIRCLKVTESSDLLSLKLHTLMSRWPFQIESMNHATAYLVKSSSLGTLAVFRYKHFGESWLTVGFKIYALCMGAAEAEAETTLKWTEIKNLGDDVLFVGDNASFSLAASYFPACHPGSIYFTDEYIHQSLTMDHPYMDQGPADTGVFNVKDNIVTHCSNLETTFLDRPPIWVVPSCEVLNFRSRFT